MVVGFASLFLGLVLGVHPIVLTVSSEVAAVELLLDGSPEALLAAPPWRTEIDFGPELVPHELVAVARDAEGNELGRAGQWINLARPPAEATVILEGGEAGRGVVARVGWESLAGAEPVAVRASFDGVPLTVSNPRVIPLPAFDPQQLHFLRAEFEFTANVSATAEVVFGGVYHQETRSDLTAVPVALDDGAALPEPADLQGWFESRGAPLSPVAVEEGPAEVVVVMDRAAQAALLRAHGGSYGRLGRGGSRGGSRTVETGDAAERRLEMRLAEEQILRFLWPFSRAREGGHARYEMFPRSEDHPPSHGGVLFLLTAAHLPPYRAEDQRLADAVAVAGLSASARNRRRAVVLVLSDRPRDASSLDPTVVRRFLARLGVPLFVWSVGVPPEEVAAAWGEVARIDGRRGIEQVVEHLRRTLDRQRIVWLEGSHLPQAVTVTARARGVRPVVERDEG